MMETNENNSMRKRFIKKILVVDVAFIIVAGLVALVLNLNFGTILFFLGLIVGGVGALFGRPNFSGPNSPKYFKYQRWPPKIAAYLRSFDVKDSVPSYAFEDVMTFAGLIAVILSTPFIAQIMFSK